MDGTRLVVVAVGWLSGWWLLVRLRPVPPRSVAPSAPVPGAVSVIIPARDEAQALPALLASLDGQVGDVVVVDDGSADGTGAVAAAAGAHVITAPAPPDGWTGKAWACHLGADQTAGDLLLFLDADTDLAADAVERLVADHHGGLLSVQPWHRCGRPVESLSAVFNLVSMMGVGAFAGLPGDRSVSAAFGPVMLCRRDDYVAIGGHAAVRSAIVEDVALARRFRRAGLPVRCRAGARTAEFRMYPEGGHQLIEGWTKNIAEGAWSATRPWALALTVWWVVALATVAGEAVAHPGLTTIAAYAAVAGQLGWLLRRIGRYAWWAWAAWPVPLVVFVALFVRSLAMRVGRRPVSWKGRSIPTRQ